jgi:hypothetical protein
MNLELTRSRAQNGFRVVLTDDQKAHRTRLHAEMVKNIVLHTIRLSEYERDEQIYTRVKLTEDSTILHSLIPLAAHRSRARRSRPELSKPG